MCVRQSNRISRKGSGSGSHWGQIFEDLHQVIENAGPRGLQIGRQTCKFFLARVKILIRDELETAAVA